MSVILQVQDGMIRGKGKVYGRALACLKDEQQLPHPRAYRILIALRKCSVEFSDMEIRALEEAAPRRRHSRPQGRGPREFSRPDDTERLIRVSRASDNDT